MSLAERRDDAAATAAVDDPSQLRARLDMMRQAVLTRPMPDRAARADALHRLESAVRAHADDFAAAIAQDFGNRARPETMLADVFVVLGALSHARKHLKRWMRPRKRSVGLHFLPASAQLLPQPLGVVGIIAPWNYPVSMALTPLAGALAAGNRVMVKPSELTPATAALLARVIGEVFAPDEVCVVTGDASVGAAFAALPFDHLLFTGSTAVGRQVMAAAAQNLTPVTLELGGKSPVLIAPGADLKRAAASIVHGKLFNAGQTCIAPDYVLVPRDAATAFVDAALAAARRYYPTLAGNADYTSIVNERHFARLNGLIDDARDKGAQIWTLEDPAAAGERKLPLTLVVEPTEDMAVMQQEIFGPVMPVVAYDSVDEAIAYVNGRDRPLALYIFDHDRARIDDVLARTWAGGVCVNDTLLHAGIEDLPFGGIGPSGMGQYHGEEGFETFSKLKPVLTQPRLNGTWMMRPPYGARVRRLISFLLRG